MNLQSENENSTIQNTFGSLPNDVERPSSELLAIEVIVIDKHINQEGGEIAL